MKRAAAKMDEDDAEEPLPGRGGRKSKAEELGLLKKQKAFLKELPSLGAGATYAGCQDYLKLLNDGLIGGLLTGAMHERLQKSVALVLRSLRQRHQTGELEELRELLEAARAIKAKAKSKATAERDRTR